MLLLLLLSRFSRVSVRPHRWQPTRLPCPWDSPGKNPGVGCHFLLQRVKMKVKLLSHVRLLATPWTAYQGPASMGVSRQEDWSGGAIAFSKKNIYFCFIDYTKAFDCMDHNKMKNSSRDGNTRPPDLPPDKYVCGSRSNRTWNNRLVQNLEGST